MPDRRVVQGTKAELFEYIDMYMTIAQQRDGDGGRLGTRSQYPQTSPNRVIIICQNMEQAGSKKPPGNKVSMYACQ